MYENKNKIIILLIIITLLFSLFTVFIYSESAPGISARSAALYEPETQNFLYTKDPNKRLAMASTTKIMTALLALELLPQDEMIAVDSRAVGIEGSSVYLKSGEIINALDLIYALLLQSANDAAAAIAYRIAGSIEDFAHLMNEKARELGLTDTNFTNPHGLDDKNHYTTAHDLAIITAEALNNKDFKTISSTYKKEVTTSECTRILVNHNKLLKSYDGCIGVKTGYTKKSGRSLVSAAERDGLTFISVTIDAPDDWNDHKKLLDYGYSMLKAEILAVKGQFSYKIPVLNGNDEFISVSNEKEIKRIVGIDEENVESHVKLSRYVSAPIRKGDILGIVIFTQNGKEIDSVNLIAQDSVDVYKRKGKFPFFDKFKC